MYYKFTAILSLVCFVVIMSGCSALLTQQEWSENYALLDGTKANSIEMIDGDMNTVGVVSSTSNSASNANRTSAALEVIVNLPEKKVVRKIVIHSDNIKNFILYADKGGKTLTGTDWQMIKTVQRVKSHPIVIPILYAFPTDRIRLTVLGTTDDGALTRNENAKELQASGVDCATGGS